MLNQNDLEEYKSLVEKATKAKNNIQQIQTEINLYKKQGLEALKECGYEKFTDLPKIQEEMLKLEKEIISNKEEMVNYIQYVNEKQEEKERIMLG